MTHWNKVCDLMPPTGVTILSYHEEDLYPQPAYVLFFDAATPTWMAEGEGPETCDDRNNTIIRELYRPPTHWRHLPDLPFTDITERDQ